jgi:hypothetical protein
MVFCASPAHTQPVPIPTLWVCRDATRSTAATTARSSFAGVIWANARAGTAASLAATRPARVGLLPRPHRPPRSLAAAAWPLQKGTPSRLYAHRRDPHCKPISSHTSSGGSGSTRVQGAIRIYRAGGGRLAVCRQWAPSALARVLGAGFWGTKYAARQTVAGGDSGSKRTRKGRRCVAAAFGAQRAASIARGGGGSGGAFGAGVAWQARNGLSGCEGKCCHLVPSLAHCQCVSVCSWMGGGVQRGRRACPRNCAPPAGRPNGTPPLEPPLRKWCQGAAAWRQGRRIIASTHKKGAFIHGRGEGPAHGEGQRSAPPRAGAALSGRRCPAARR